MDGPFTERASFAADPIPGKREGAAASSCPARPAPEGDALAPLLLDQRFQNHLWRGHRVHDSALLAEKGIPSGYPALDAVLPDGGFPAAALTEIFVPSVEPIADFPAGFPSGKGELALVLPALARLAPQRLITLVAPPAVPYAPAFAAAGIDLGRLVVVRPRDARDAAWAAEQALRDGNCAAVLVWLDHALLTGLRRLQLAAEAGGTLGLLYRPWAARRSASPAALRLALAPTAVGLRVEVFKCRGSSVRSSVEVVLRDGFVLQRALKNAPQPAA